MSDLQRRDQKSCSALIGYASPLLHMTPCDVVDVKVELELMGTGLLARLVKSVQSHLPFSTTNWFWSDSMTTLA